MCDHKLGDLACTNAAEHEGGGRGCCHEASSGSWVGDKHDATSGGEH
jgi:hypothetical protein